MRYPALRLSFLLYPAMIALLLAGVWAAWSWRAQAVRVEREAVAQGRAAIERIGREISYRATLHDAELNGRGWPITVDTAWFQGRLPRNPMVPLSNPWLEVAGEQEHALSHPPQLLVVDGRVASFWYNPANGIVRARVSQTVSDRKALELYNAMNGARLRSLFLPESTVLIVDAAP